MAIKRIVPNIAAEKLDKPKAFYGSVLGRQIVMDLGWMPTFASQNECAPQNSFASEDGSCTRVSNRRIEVDNLDETCKHMRRAGYKTEYAGL